MGCNLKPFEATQRVRHPPGRSAARQPEASLAWGAVTSLVKRRQRKLKPCVSLEIMSPLRPSVWFARGAVLARPIRARTCQLGRGLGAGQRLRMGRQETCEIARAHGESMPGRERRLNKGPRPDELPPSSSGVLRRTRTQEGRVEPVTETISERVCAAGSRSTLIVL